MAKYDTETESKINRVLNVVIPILATLMLLAGVVLLWIGIGLYYGYRNSFWIGANLGLPTALFLYPNIDVGAVYIVAAILATFGLIYTLIPIISSFTKFTSPAFLAFPACLALLNIFILSFLIPSLIVASVFYNRAQYAVTWNQSCQNMETQFPGVREGWCQGFMDGYRLIIAGHVLSIVPLALVLFLLCQQMGRIGKGEPTSTTYVERRTDVSVA